MREHPIVAPSVKSQGHRKIDEEKLKKACSEFESIFIQNLLKSMRQTVPESKLFGGGTGKSLFESMFDQEVSKHIATRGGVGLGKIIYENVMRHTRASSPTTLPSLTETQGKPPRPSFRSKP